MDISFELYKIFYHAASAGSFTEAARRLFITQSAVSQAVRSLEEKTGAALFNRKSKKITLTAEGRLLYTHVEQAYHHLKSAEEKLYAMNDLLSGEVRIGVGDTVCRHFLVPCIDQFIKRYPGIKVRVVNRTSSQIIEILKNGKTDIGIVTLPQTDPSMEYTVFRRVRDVFVASSKYAALSGRQAGLGELASLPLLLLEKSSSTRQNLDSFFEKHGLALHPELELESVDLLVEFAKIGLGIAHVLEESAAEAIRKGELFVVRTETGLPERVLGIAVPSRMPISRAASVFREMLVPPSC